MKRGLVLGKFMPPHAGHLELARFAHELCDDVDIVVGSLAHEPIPGGLRFQWMKELCPWATVHHLTDENPALPNEHPDFWGIWKRSLESLLPDAPTHVFASETYGAKLSDILGATFVPLDRATGVLDDLSGTGIRRDPASHWDALPGVVRPYFQERIHIVGPESTGKTTLARELATALRTAWVPEYARTWLERAGNPRDTDGLATIDASDMPVIARGHAARARAIAPHAGPTLVLDTDALTTAVWSEVLFGSVDDQVLALEAEETPTLTLLTDCDLDWEPDAVRYRPGDRAAFRTRLCERLDRLGRPWMAVSGTGATRLDAAVRALDDSNAQRARR